MSQANEPSNLPQPGKTPLGDTKDAAEKIKEKVDPIVRQTEKAVDEKLSEPAQQAADGIDKAREAAKRKIEEAHQAGKSGGDEPEPEKFTSKNEQHKNHVSPSVMPLGTDTWFLQQGYDQQVHFPARPNNRIIPFFSSAECLERIAGAIKAAQKSISIITWGVDTDLRLKHQGTKSEYYRTEDYIERAPAIMHDGVCISALGEPFYPAMQSLENKDFFGQKRVAATPYTDSYVLSDLLTSAAKRGVKVWMLVWEPAILAKNVIDPLHLWWRSKTKMVENMEFAFRAYEGVKMSKPSKKYLQSDDTGKTALLADANQNLEDRLDVATSDKYGAIRNYLVYTHHQKEILIDIEDPEKAVGFIVGFNLKEEYWDSADHSAVNEFRHPYAPWQDLGIEVYGEVLHDMAQNVKEGWEQMRAAGPGGIVGTTTDKLSKELMAKLPWSTDEDERARAEARQRYDAYWEQKAGRDFHDLTNEVYPEHLIGAALAAGLGKEAKEIHGKDILDRYDAESYKYLMANGSLELGTAEEWGYKLAPQCIELCHYLTTLSMIFYGLMTKSFVGDGMLRPSPIWDLSIPKPGAFKAPADAPNHTAQFFRTFPLAGMPKEVSIFKAYLQAIRNVQNGQLIYIENQYFRDEYIVGELILRRKQGIDFNLVIVANPLTDWDGKFLTEENMFGEGPMKVCLDRLERSRINYRICWLRVKEQTVPAYAPIRKIPKLGYLVGVLAKADLAGEVDWAQRFDVSMKYRNYLFDRCYPLLLKKDEQGKSSAENLDDVANAQVNQAVKDYKAIRAAVESLKPKFESVENTRDALQRAQHDMTVATFNHTADAYAQEIDAALKKMVEQVELTGDKMVATLPGEKRGQMYDRWTYNFRDFWASVQARLGGSEKGTPVPFITTDKYYMLIQKEMAAYAGQKKPAAKGSKFGSLTGHIYVHTKLMIVDGTYAIIGSANINERSMWHDTEVALGFRASAEGSKPREMLKTLCEQHFGMEPPYGEQLFKKFSAQLNSNNEIYNQGTPTNALIMHALPLIMRDEAMASAPSAG